MKYIVVSGGVVSGIGKGIVSSSVGTILKSKGYKVVHIKIDPYLNFSAGMMAPSEHGEVYVLNDGTETDLDLGNYERFLGIELRNENAITSGKVMYELIKKEKNGAFEGKTLQVNPHCVDNIIDRIKKVSESEVFDEYLNTKFKPEFVIIELGGTVGDAESVMYLDALYKFASTLPKEDFCLISVDFLVELHGFEHKTRPLQVSARNLRSFGLKSDIIVCRGQCSLNDDIIKKISDKCFVDSDSIILLPNLNCVYKVPSYMNKKGLFKCLQKKMNIVEKSSSDDLFNKFEILSKRFEKVVKIGIVAKYAGQEDTYSSLIHAILFSSFEVGVNAEIEWINAESLEENIQTEIEKMKKCDSILIPGGFGYRGIEGKMIAINYCRENNVPLLGICLGLQLSVIEFARNVLNLKNATSEEFEPKAETHVITFLDFNGVQTKALRLGANNIVLAENSKALSIYKNSMISERHRHRYGINKDYIGIFNEQGFICSGRSECDNVAEIFELKEHPFFVGVQYHPEFNAKPLKPSPLFTAFIRAGSNSN
ncbi:hypothetical protein P3W45_000085 [Vairimorpha bombi]|jgi:CTP synthase